MSEASPHQLFTKQKIHDLKLVAIVTGTEI